MNSLNEVLPSRKKILKSLARVFPLPRFEVNTRGLTTTVELTYRPKGTREAASICSCEIPPKGNQIGAMNALAVSAFKAMGFDAVWDPKFPGRYVFTPVKDYVGPEKLIPAEMDPTVTTEAEALGMAAGEPEQKN